MNRIRDLRQKNHLTQEELGRLLNVQKSAISKYETGKIPLTDETIRQMTKIFGVSANYLLGLDSAPERSYWETRLAALKDDSLRDLEKYIELLELRDRQAKSSPDKKYGASNTFASQKKSAL